MNQRLIKLRTMLTIATLGIFLRIPCEAATHVVAITGGAFDPDQISITAGDTIEWFAHEPDHTVTSEDGLFDSNTVWDSIPTEETFSYTFTDVGQFNYYCTVHGGPGGAGMAGIIFVLEAGENQSPSTPINLLPVNGATNQPLTLQLSANAFSDPDALDFHAASQWIVRRVSDNQMVFDSGADSISKTNLTIPAGALAQGSNYIWQVRYQDGRGAWSEYSAATSFRTLVEIPANGIGLRASYNNIVDFVSPIAIATNAVINFNWGNDRPHRRITANDFSIRWDGFLLPQFTEQYEIQFEYQGGARVWVNNQLLIDEWAGCSFSQSRRGSISLIGGQLVTLRVEYAADTSGATAILRWASPSQPMQVIPTIRLFPASP
jgi:plastocyanin